MVEGRHGRDSVVETAPTKRSVRKPAARPRRRAAKPKVPVSQESTTDGSLNNSDQAATGRRESTRLVEQLVILALALVFALIGLAVHVLWIPAIVLMSVLFGWIASELRGRSGGGVISEVATTVMVEAKGVAEGIANAGTNGTKEQGEEGSS